jgi:hypothetical protein
MTSNIEAKEALKSFLEMERPGYALLLDAPWGVGKTHFVRAVCRDVSVEHRYVTVNGVADENSFRRALLTGSYASVRAVTSALDTIKRLPKIGDFADVAQDMAEARLLKMLPDILVFDDIERSTINPQELLGLINDFVEHQGKRVVLLMNSERHEQSTAFLKHKEKLIGKTLRIAADIDAALPTFLESVQDGTAKTWLSDHADLVGEVFNQAGHENLRLLRNALRECALILDRLEADLFAAKEPMARFVRTYLALAMALARGEITDDDIEKLDRPHLALSVDDQNRPTPLRQLCNRHTGADIVTTRGAVISTKLARHLFIDGFADSETLNKSLRDTGQFIGQDENPLWLRMVHFFEAGWDHLRSLVEEGWSYLFNASDIQPGPYLHIADNMLSIANRGGLDIDGDTLKGLIVRRISDLKDSGAIPPAKFGSDLGWSNNLPGFSFGGYGREPTEEFKDVLQAMEEAQLELYREGIAEEAGKLLSLYEHDVDAFIDLLGYSPDGDSYFRVPIFDKIDRNRFAEITVQYLVSGRTRELRELLGVIDKRHTNYPDLDVEKPWFRSLRHVLDARAKEHSPLAQAQLAMFLESTWKIEESPIDDSE